MEEEGLEQGRDSDEITSIASNGELQTALRGGAGASEERGLPPLAFTGRHFSLGIRPVEHPPTHTHVRCEGTCTVLQKWMFCVAKPGIFHLPNGSF